MNYTEQLDLLWEQMRIDIANKVRKIGKINKVGALTISVLDTDVQFKFTDDLYLTEVGENDLFDNACYERAFGVLDYEQLAGLTDYLSTL